MESSTEKLESYLTIMTRQMKVSLEKENLSESFNHAVSMLEVLNREIEPKEYYKLYMAISQEFSQFASFLSDLEEEKLVELYDYAQTVEFALSRMYLLILIGTTAVRNGFDEVSIVLTDLHEMTRCVQNPLKTLFIRHFLITQVKSLLPDTVSEYKTDDGFESAVHFILQNFREMSKVWLRLTYLSELKTENELKKHELRILVASNLVKLSQMDLSHDFYKNNILEVLCKDIKLMKDPKAEDFLFECILNVFPESFHASTLETLMELLCSFSLKSSMTSGFKVVVQRIKTRILNLKEADNLEEAGETLKKLFGTVGSITKKEDEFSTSYQLMLYHHLLNVLIETFPDKTEYLGELLSNIHSIKGLNDMNEESVEELYRMLCNIVENCCDIYITLCNESFKTLSLHVLQEFMLISKIIDRCVSDKIYFDNSEKLKVIEFYAIDTMKGLSEEILNEKEEGSMYFLNKILKNIPNSDNYIRFKLMNSFLSNVCVSVSAKLLTDFVPVFVFEFLEILKYSRNDASEYEKLCKISNCCLKLISKLEIPPNARLSIELLMSLLLAISDHVINENNMSKEVLTKIFITYEDEILDSKSQLDTLISIISKMNHLKNVDTEVLTQFSNRCVLLSCNLLKTEDQFVCLLLCAKLHFSIDIKNKVSSILSRAKKIIVSASNKVKKTHMLTELLDNYAYFLHNQCPDITLDQLKDIHNQIETTQDDKYTDSVYGNISTSYPQVWDTLKAE